MVLVSALTLTFGAASPSTGSPWFDSAVLVALIGLATAVLERRHQRRMDQLERKNDEQHGRGYGLLESIDRRTSDMQRDVDAIREDIGGLRQWQTDHEARHARDDHERTQPPLPFAGGTPL